MNLTSVKTLYQAEMARSLRSDCFLLTLVRKSILIFTADIPSFSNVFGCDSH